ncbi:MAG TPA: malto-oligosyltrehalose trehalohydrolase [Nitriliruptorales bacterium]|nr:malto-oligosyltrehalose trehalohydrolase [Nitriliruptorales bacterium]
MRLGSWYLGDGCTSFLVWASKAEQVEVLLDDGRALDLAPRELGYFALTARGVRPGARYRYRLDGELQRPDPASRSQPEGVHGPSEVIDPTFAWSDQHWHGIPLRDHVIYELHVGTFTPGGTFDSAVERLDDLAALGVTAIEIMPIAEFPGGRNWGYDGVQPFAAQSTYGGPDGFRRLVDSCHARGLAVILDVVYNHFGPEGAYQPEFGHYLTERYRTPWGPAINFDDAWSEQVRRYVIENALYWVDDCHVDGLRLDAVHAIFDQSALHVLDEVGRAVHDLAERRNRRVHVIAESDLNDPRLIRPPAIGGYGLDAQWSDDFHHALHALLTGESDGYYADFGSATDLATALVEGYVYTWQRSHHRGRRHGQRPMGVPGERFVVCAQNHDQVGNRRDGERLSSLVPFEALGLAAMCVLLSPYVPLLFMGEEYGETAPFQYFVSHSDPDLVDAVRRGRAEEFAAFRWAGEPPDPQAEETFQRSKLDHALNHQEPHATLLDLHRRLLRLRRQVPAFASLDRDRIEVTADPDRRVVTWRRWTEDGSDALVTANFDVTTRTVAPTLAGRWRLLLTTREDVGAPEALLRDTSFALASHAAAVYVRDDGP